MDWDKLRIFHMVVMAGSFTRAAKQLNLGQSSVSRQIQALETSLDIQLFRRQHKGLLLTPQGELIYQASQEIAAKLDLTEALLYESQGAVRGVLTVGCSAAYSGLGLMPYIKEFLDTYPSIRLNLKIYGEDQTFDPQSADIIIATHPPLQSGYVTRLLFSCRLGYYASQQYLQQYGTPLSIEDLDYHSLLTFKSSREESRNKVQSFLQQGSQRGHHREAVFESNSYATLLEAVKAGIGIGELYNFMVKEQHEGIEILPAYTQTVEYYLIYPEQLHFSARIQAFCTFIQQKVMPFAN
ncbi:MAG: LysR family transcriptional regulator [Alphaproteobacteria bacterium]|nr:LysR family transcriptional regulator [Alphaproteobacteria bacterium]